MSRTSHASQIPLVSHGSGYRPRSASRRLDHRPGHGGAPAAAAAPAPRRPGRRGPGTRRRRRSARGRAEQHRHHAVVAGQPTHQAGVAVDSRRHVPDAARDHRHPPRERARFGLAPVIAPRRRRVAMSSLERVHPPCRCPALASRRDHSRLPPRRSRASCPGPRGAAEASRREPCRRGGPGRQPVGGAAQLRRARPSAARPDVLRGRPRDDRRLGRGRLDDHRDRRGQGARRRGARRVPDPGQPRTPRSRRSSRCSPASPTPWSADAPPIESVLPAVPGVRRAAACWSPTTRRSTSASSSDFAAPPGPAVADVRGARHRQARPPGDHPRRRPQLQALLARARLPRHDHAQPPRARPTPAPPSTCCTG